MMIAACLVKLHSEEERTALLEASSTVGGAVVAP